MAKLTISDAARACRVARSTLQRAVNAGRLSLDADHRVDTAELLRAGYTLHAARHDATRRVQEEALQDAAARSTPPRQTAASPSQGELELMKRELALVERERDLLRATLDAAAAREQEARVNAQAARDERALLLQMLQDMQHRYDRLLEAPRTPPPLPGPGAPAAMSAPRGDMRRRIVALLQEHPEGLSPVQTRQLLGLDKDLGSTVKAMARDGLLRRVETGRYVVGEARR